MTDPVERPDLVERLRNGIRYEAIYIATGTTKSPGGQQAGTPPMAVRGIHEETGLMAQCPANRSQHIAKLIVDDMILSALTHPRFRP